METELVDIAWLRPHEEIQPERVEALREKLQSQGFIHKPILVDRASGTILDGHHRYTASLELGLTRMPALLFDYLEDDSIVVDLWPSATIESISKQDIVDLASRGERLTPKTSRHTLPADVPRIAVPLSDLR